MFDIRFHLETDVDLDYFAVKVIVNKQWCVDYFTKVSQGRLPTKQVECFVDEEQAATVTHISKEKGNVMYLDSEMELWDSLIYSESE